MRALLVRGFVFDAEGPAKPAAGGRAQVLGPRPQNNSAEIIDKLNKEVNAALADGGLRERLGDLGGTVTPGSSADFGKLVADETEKWAKVIRAANIKIE